MSISLEYFKSAKFDGNLYLKCYGEMSENIEIKYKLIDSDTKDTYEYYSDNNQLACFTPLKPANYTIETTIIENGKVTKKTSIRKYRNKRIRFSI
ncbi:hypothetical protein [Photorhabdus temperata]|uniref:hypothetical protein n=1 Tax=Photorhabdus temperata TaxID=574560 RepID=UPI000401C006|nr:hypothetical protein [Photorhabdus temperata]